MIHMPHRSVTRFFVPLIDVLLLLFCIFLLMPYVKSNNILLCPSDSQPTASPDANGVTDILGRGRRSVGVDAGQVPAGQTGQLGQGGHAVAVTVRAAPYR